MKTAVVTGVSRGIGLAIAGRLLADGFTVVGISRTQSSEYCNLVNAHPSRAFFEHLDVSEIAAIPDAARRLTRAHGHIFALVNNAGIGIDGVLATMHQSDIQRVLNTNLMAPITLAKYLSRGMLARGDGRIVNISSVIASTGFHGLSVYAASKAGLEGFTRSLARELGKRNVTVNCVAPGYLETSMTGGLDQARMDSIRRRAPLGLPNVTDVAGAVAYLLGPDGARVTGTVLRVDGGSAA